MGLEGYVGGWAGRAPIINDRDYWEPWGVGGPGGRTGHKYGGPLRVLWRAVASLIMGVGIELGKKASRISVIEPIGTGELSNDAVALGVQAPLAYHPSTTATPTAPTTTCWCAAPIHATSWGCGSHEAPTYAAVGHLLLGLHLLWKAIKGIYAADVCCGGRKGR